jgi:hypothetical protein
MRTSPGAHSAHALAPSGWFAIAIVATVAFVAAGTVSWLRFGGTWVAGLVFLALAAGGSLAASRWGREAATAFVGGMLITVASLYAALLVMAQIYAVVLD